MPKVLCAQFKSRYNVFLSVNRLACGQVHFVSRKTGKTAREKMANRRRGGVWPPCQISGEVALELFCDGDGWSLRKSERPRQILFHSCTRQAKALRSVRCVLEAQRAPSVCGTTSREMNHTIVAPVGGENDGEPTRDSRQSRHGAGKRLVMATTARHP
jgi:hypothetical protein